MVEVLVDDFPGSVRNALNLIDSGSQHTDDIEGYVFDGADGSQVAFWTCPYERVSSEHEHPFDEYLIVAAGRYTVTMEGRSIELRPGDELVIPRGVVHGGRCIAGTRTIHHFAGHRADRRQSGTAGALG
ncbi:MAG: cupin domain-containing protein [Polyangiaceae bacterium]|nr:cupin domain-containing protein [Polyangiaceae bacterium]